MTEPLYGAVARRRYRSLRVCFDLQLFTADRVVDVPLTSAGLDTATRLRNPSSRRPPRA